jgi:hypothetical protein
MMFNLARYFAWFDNRIVTEWELDGGRADMLVISRAGYATEIEVKVSRADWRKDAAKAKWAVDREHVARFFFAVPSTLLEPAGEDSFGIQMWKVPDFVHPAAGVMAHRQHVLFPVLACAHGLHAPAIRGGESVSHTCHFDQGGLDIYPPDPLP